MTCIAVSKFHYPQGASVNRLRFHLIREHICHSVRGIYKVPSRRQLWRTLISTNINSQCINIPICQFTNLFNERKIWKSWNKRVGTYSRTQYVNRPFSLSPSSEREPRERKWPREILGASSLEHKQFSTFGYCYFIVIATKFRDYTFKGI